MNIALSYDKDIHRFECVVFEIKKNTFWAHVIKLHDHIEPEQHVEFFNELFDKVGTDKLQIGRVFYL